MHVAIPGGIVGDSILAVGQWEKEIRGYWDILLGRTPLPVENGVLSLQESAVALHSRASEIAAIIQEQEYKGIVSRGDRAYHFRTGPLRTFMAASSKAIELGSRRVTWLQLEIEMREED
jgi:hypothetical protein